MYGVLYNCKPDAQIQIRWNKRQKISTLKVCTYHKSNNTTWKSLSTADCLYSGLEFVILKITGNSVNDVIQPTHSPTHNFYWYAQVCRFCFLPSLLSFQFFFIASHSLHSTFENRETLSYYCLLSHPSLSLSRCLPQSPAIQFDCHFQFTCIRTRLHHWTSVKMLSDIEPIWNLFAFIFHLQFVFVIFLLYILNIEHWTKEKASRPASTLLRSV